MIARLAYRGAAHGQTRSTPLENDNMCLYFLATKERAQLVCSCPLCSTKNGRACNTPNHSRSIEPQLVLLEFLASCHRCYGSQVVLLQKKKTCTGTRLTRWERANGHRITARLFVSCVSVVSKYAEGADDNLACVDFPFRMFAQRELMMPYLSWRGGRARMIDGLPHVMVTGVCCFSVTCAALSTSLRFMQRLVQNFISSKMNLTLCGAANMWLL